MPILALLTSLALAADPTPLALTEVAFGTGFGAMPLPLGPLNDSLTAAGHPALGAWQITSLSVNAELWIGRLIPGFDSIGFSNVGAEKAGATDSTFTFSLTELSFGYAAVYKPRFNFQPRIGFGLGDTTVTINQTGPVNALSAIKDASRAVSFHRQDMLADVGIGFGWLVPIGRSDVSGVGTGLRFAVRAGALLQLFHTAAWKSDGEKVEDMPNLYLAGPYLRLFFSPSLTVRYPKLHTTKRDGHAPKHAEEAAPVAPSVATEPVSELVSEPVPAAVPEAAEAVALPVPTTPSEPPTP